MLKYNAIDEVLIFLYRLLYFISCILETVYVKNEDSVLYHVFNLEISISIIDTTICRNDEHLPHTWDLHT